MKVTIELEVNKLQDLAGLLAGATNTFAKAPSAEQEPDEVVKEAKASTKKTETKTKTAVKKNKTKVEPEPEPECDTEEKPVYTKAEIKGMLTQFCTDNDGGAAKVQAEFKAIGIASLSEASVEQLNEVVAKLGL